jgi:hypothetical protein
MMEYDDWINSIVTVLEEFASQEFQKRVWLRGEGPEVSSYEEVVNRFFDDYAINELIDVEWRQAGLTEEVRKTLTTFRNTLEEFNELVPVLPHPKDILRNSKWPQVRKAAQDTLNELKKRTKK